MKPPQARKDHKEENHFGINLVDDYHYMRDKESEEVLSYLKAENAYTEEWMRHTLPMQDKLFNEMKKRLNETDETYPYRWGEYYYYTRTEEGKNYPIYCRKSSPDAEEEIILNVNQLSEGHEYCDVGDIAFNSDHSLMMYTVDYSGYETYDIIFKDLITGENTSEEILNVGNRIVVVGEFLYYNELDEIHRAYSVMRHILGSDQSEDIKLIQENDNRFFLSQYTSMDEKYLFVISNGPDTITSYFLDLTSGEKKLNTFQERVEGEEFVLSHHEGMFYFTTNRDAKNYKLCSTPVTDTSESAWNVLLEHDINRKVEYPTCFKDYLLVFVRKDGFRSLQYKKYNEDSFRDVDLPEKIYSVMGSNSNHVYDTRTYRFRYSSLVTPLTDFELDFTTGKLNPLKVELVHEFIPENYITERLEAKASDGTAIPLSVAYKKGTLLDGSAPLLLYGYGSYGISIDPSFDFKRLSLLDRGVVYCIAHIRGGGELGRLWYEGGKLKNKMNTFTDFIAAAEHLIEKGYTNKNKLAINGRSAGGLLIGATVNLRPDLFKVAVAQVPFVDVMNTMLDESIPLTTFEYKEWGNPNIEEEFKWMYEYSPYDNVEPKEYPNLLITGGLTDPRVHFWEPTKWACKLRDNWKGDNVLLLKINMGSGHFGASRRYDYMKETAFYYSFILDLIA